MVATPVDVVVASELEVGGTVLVVGASVVVVGGCVVVVGATVVVVGGWVVVGAPVVVVGGWVVLVGTVTAGRSVLAGGVEVGSDVAGFPDVEGVLPVPAAVVGVETEAPGPVVDGSPDPELPQAASSVPARRASATVPPAHERLSFGERIGLPPVSASV